MNIVKCDKCGLYHIMLTERKKKEIRYGKNGSNK